MVLFALLASWLPVVLMRWLEPPVTAFMLQHRAETGSSNYHYQWKDWPELGSAAALAVMAAEDQKFPDHHGFDITAIQGAVADRLDGQALRGASTISQQVAKNLFLWPGRSLVRKAMEAWFTTLIELSWPGSWRCISTSPNLAPASMASRPPAAPTLPNRHRS